MAESTAPHSINPSAWAFEQAVRIVTDYVDHPNTGWDTERYDRVQKILNDWQLLLFQNRMHASHDAEKS